MINNSSVAVVRCVDRAAGRVYLLPNIGPHQMTHVNTLAICNIPMPTSLLLNQSGRTTGPVPFVYNTDDFVGSKQIVQITYRPERFTHQRSGGGD